jgi:DNA sulfur modification protein DndC
LRRDLNWVVEDAVSFTVDDGRLLEENCHRHDVPTDLVVRLLDIERSAHGLKRRHAVHTRIEDVFRQEWRDIEAVIAERRAERDEEIRIDDGMASDAEQALLDPTSERASS